MFSRIITMHPKPNTLSQLTKAVEEQVLPMLRKQEGFKDEIFFVSPDGRDATAISMWDRQANAEAYSHKAYPQVAEMLTNLLEGSPQVKTYDVVNSTCHKIAAQVPV
jgi:quinol monooxygenase YgiN